MADSKRLARLALLVLIGLSIQYARHGTVIEPPSATAADEAPGQLETSPDAAKQPSLAKFLTVRSPVDDVMSGRVKNLAIELSHRAVREKRRAFFCIPCNGNNNTIK